ncbi:MAG: AMP-binding protein, partial [Methylococcaceae bacterium]|nr:AMP-binding protein [Methylococcaceae bacterium]
MLSSEILRHLKTALPEQHKPILSGFIRELLVDFLELDSLEEVAEDQNFMDLGTDSMQAVDFKFKLEQLLQCSLKSTLLFDYPRLDLLTEYLLNDVLHLPNSHSKTADFNPKQPIANPVSEVNEIAIIAMAGIFPGAENVEGLWEKVMAGESLKLSAQNAGQHLDFGRLTNLHTAALDKLGITQAVFLVMDRQQQLMFKVIADAMVNFDVSSQALSKQTTGVFIAAQQTVHDRNVPYQIPIANKLSFQLNLKGPSESVNTFCTSVYVALNRAIQSIQAGECQQAIVGGVNIIAAEEFAAAASAGLYDTILSADNQTKSFCDDASGYVRSEGAGVILLKPLSQAEQEGNNILAIVKSAAVYHGGRGYSYEAPNPQGLKATIKISIEKAGINTDSIDYVEAHGIGNVMADALELGAINQCYRALSARPDKHWHISCIKPTLGHPEMASGIASLLKVLKALEHKTLPGIANFGVINSELAADHALILQAENHPWPDTPTPRRVALNSYAIGGMNAHVILEEYRNVREALQGNNSIAKIHNSAAKIDPDANDLHDVIVADLMREIFNLELEHIDQSLSLVDYGFDSIKVMQFVTQLNEKLALDIKISQVLSVDHFADFFTLLACARANNQGKLTGQAQESMPKVVPCLIQGPLSQVQKGLWYVNEIASDSISFNIPMTFKITGKVDQDKLRQALAMMLEEYPMLRAGIVQQEGTEDIMQRIRPIESCLNLQVIQLDLKQQLNLVLLALLRQPFDLSTDALLRLFVIEAADTSYVFFVIHHIVFDGTSGALFIPSFWGKYHALIAGKTLVTQPPDLAFLDYVNWERAYLDSAKAVEDQAWWQAQLAGQAPTVNLPYDRLPQSTLSTSGIGCQKFTLDEASFTAMKNLASKLKANLSVLFLTAFQIFLHKLAQEQEIAVTVPVRGRPKQVHENSIGCYINIIVIPCSLAAEKSFSELVQETRQQFFNCLDHAQYPFPKILADLGLTLTNPKENPFPVSYTYQNFFDELLNNATVMQGVEPLYDIYQQTEDNYTLEIYDFRKTLQLNFKYKRSLFDDETIVRHTTYFNNLLAAIIADAEQAVKHYELLPPAEKQRVLTTFNATQLHIPKHRCLHELFAEQAAQTPDNLAVIFADRHLSYRQLHEKSTQLAIYLQQQGVTPDSLVALCINRSLDMLVALLGILTAGGAYLPIDAALPAERIKSLLQESGARLLLTQQALLAELSAITQGLDCQLIALDTHGEQIAQAQGALAT